MAWDWRKAWAGMVPRGEFIFHAYDTQCRAACNPAYGLADSIEEPNEGSEFCHECMDVVAKAPFGRPRKERA